MMVFYPLYVKQAMCRWVFRGTRVSKGGTIVAFNPTRGHHHSSKRKERSIFHPLPSISSVQVYAISRRFSLSAIIRMTLESKAFWRVTHPAKRTHKGTSRTAEHARSVAVWLAGSEDVQLLTYSE